MKKQLFLFAALLIAVCTWAQNDDMLSTPLTLEAIKTGIVVFENRADGPVTYRVNGGETQSIESKATGEIALKAGDKVAFYGDNTRYNSSSSRIGDASHIFCTADCYVYGNIMSLITSSNFATADKLNDKYTFLELFLDNIYLKNHPSNKLMMPATRLASGCYSYMFLGCTGLTEAPKLPATTLKSGCYMGMFRDCTGLTRAPELPATRLAGDCYGEMFRGCTGLTKAPELPATTLAGQCYLRMFDGCKNLSSVTCLATVISAEFATLDWLYGVSATGTFTKAKGVEWPTGASGIPKGWTVVDYVPTGISTTTSGTKKAPATTYDQRGMKATAGKKGMKIVNGKKILTK